MTPYIIIRGVGTVSRKNSVVLTERDAFALRVISEYRTACLLSRMGFKYNSINLSQKSIVALLFFEITLQYQ
jgi:hypothetical protein